MSSDDKPLRWLEGEVKTPPFLADARLARGSSWMSRGEQGMDRETKAQLWKAGWRTGDAADFLGLSEAETEFIEMKLALAEDLRNLRRKRRLNQTQVARIVGSSQSRVAKMEVADPSVSIDLLVRTLLKLGAGRRGVAKAVARQPAIRAS